MPKVFFIPAGTKNLKPMFPAIPWDNVEEYYVEALTTGVVATTPVVKIKGCDEDVRIHFVNYLGGVDSISFAITMEHEVKSTTFQKPTGYPLNRALHGNTGLSIKANDYYKGTCMIQEEHLEWLTELFDSPLAWMEQGNEYIPVMILDKRFTKRKDVERFVYDIELEWALSHEKITIHN